MAPFVNLDVSYDVEKEPNYLGYSHGVDVPRSLAEGNSSLGKLFGNIGETVDAFAKGAYANINQHIKDDARAVLEPVQNSMGGDLSPAEAPIVAGTGARGAKYTSAAGVAGLRDSGELGMDSAKLPSDFQANVDRVKQLKTAFDAGALSDTRYKTEAAATFQRLRARYGSAWSDEIDAAIRDVNGTAANDVRKAVLNDFISMSAASGSAANKLMTTYNSEGKYLSVIEPGLTFEKFAQNPYGYMSQVNDLKAQDYAVDRKKALIATKTEADAATSKQAYQTYQEASNIHVSKVVRATMGQMAERGAALLAQGANVNPKDLEEFSSQYRAMRLGVSNQLKSLGTAPLDIGGFSDTGFPIPGDVTYSKFLKPNELKEIHDGALSRLDTVAEALGVGNTTAASAAADYIKWQGNSDFKKLVDKIPALRVFQGVRKSVGDNAMTNVLELSKGAGLEEMTSAVINPHFLDVYNTDTTTPPVKATDALNAASETHPANPGKVNRVVLSGLRDMATHDDPKVGARAVDSIYGDQKLWASTPEGQKKQIYNFLGSNEFTQKMIALRDKGEAGAWNTYSNWMENNFRGVFAQEVSDAGSAINFNHYDWSMDPKTLQITATTKPEFQSVLSPSGDAQSYVDGMNSATKLIAPILKEKYGELAASKLLEKVGINPLAQQGSFMETIGAEPKGQKDPIRGFLEGLFKSTTPESKVAPSGTGPRTDAGGTAEVAPAPQPVANAARTGDTWGNPFSKTFKAEHLTDIQTPNGKTIQVNKVAAEAFQGFLSDLAATGYQIKDIGGYSFRENKSSPGRLSQHSYGNAIDINPAKNAFGSRKSDLPSNVGELADKWGLVWGGRWSHPDPMHFEYSGAKTTKRADNGDFLTPAG